MGCPVGEVRSRKEERSREGWVPIWEVLIIWPPVLDRNWPTQYWFWATGTRLEIGKNEKINQDRKKES